MASALRNPFETVYFDVIRLIEEERNRHRTVEAARETRAWKLIDLLYRSGRHWKLDPEENDDIWVYLYSDSYPEELERRAPELGLKFSHRRIDDEYLCYLEPLHPDYPNGRPENKDEWDPLEKAGYWDFYSKAIEDLHADLLRLDGLYRWGHGMSPRELLRLE